MTLGGQVVFFLFGLGMGEKRAEQKLLYGVSIFWKFFFPWHLQHRWWEGRQVWHHHWLGLHNRLLLGAVSSTHREASPEPEARGLERVCSVKGSSCHPCPPVPYVGLDGRSICICPSSPINGRAAYLLSSLSWLSPFQSHTSFDPFNLSVLQYTTVKINNLWRVQFYIYILPFRKYFFFVFTNIPSERDIIWCIAFPLPGKDASELIPHS